MRLFYSILWLFILPLSLLRLWYRGYKEPKYRQYITERLGFYWQLKKLTAIHPILWVHAVSVGETRAAQPLIEALLQANPRHFILLTHVTVTGRTIGQQLFSQYKHRVILQSFIPYDVNWICARFLRYFKPRISILVETEIWPNMIRQCVHYKVPIILVNARLSEHSLRKWQYFKSILFDAIKHINCIAAQSNADAQRLYILGARNIFVTGNIKFDVKVPEKMFYNGNKWRQNFGKRNVLLCASTREGEEHLIIDMLAKIDKRNFLTIIVPRHPERFKKVASLVKKYGFHMELRSEMQEKLFINTEILLGDSLGEMFAYYTACDVAFIGGSLLPFGGQNLIEACFLSKPVLIGQYTFNFHVISENAVKAGAAIRIKNAEMMLRNAQILFNDNNLRMTMGYNAQKFARYYQGATVNTMKLITSLLI